MSTEYKTVVWRKARIGDNIVPGEGPFAVFMHRHYINRWYYEGYTHHETKAEAIAARDKWLETPT